MHLAIYFTVLSSTCQNRTKNNLYAK